MYFLYYDLTNGKILDFEIVNVSENTIIPKNAILLDENSYRMISHETYFWRVNLEDKSLIRDENNATNDEIPLEVVKDLKILEIKSKAQEDFLSSYIGYNSGEIDTWNQQEQGIIDIESGKDTICSRFVTKLAEVYNMNVNDLVDKIKEKVEARNEIILKILGQQKTLINKIEASTNKDEISNISWQYIVKPKKVV